MRDAYPVNLAPQASRYECRCDLCRRHRHIRKVVREGSREELCKLIDELSDQLLEVEYDRDYRAAILDGSWPSAVTLLREALAKAEAKNG